MQNRISESIALINEHNANTFVTVNVITPTHATGILKDYIFSLKDNFTVKGVLCTAGSKILHNYVPSYSSTVFELLHKASATFIGKNTLDEFGAGSGLTSLQKVINLANLNEITGGSSSGSASAVAGNEVDFAIGSDTGGSIRHPAHFCRVIGFKPAQRQISRYGLIGMSDPLDSVGILSKNIKTIKTVYAVLNQKDIKDDRSSPFTSQETPSEYILLNEFSSDTLIRVQTALKQVSEAILSAETYSLKYTDELYKRVMLPYMYSNCNKYDGVKFNNVNFNASFNNNITIQNRSKLFNSEVQYRIYAGFNLINAFRTLDYRTLNTFKTSAIYFMELTNNMKSGETYTQELEFINVFDLCAIVIPLYNDVSLQIFAAPGFEYTLINLAEIILNTHVS